VEGESLSGFDAIAAAFSKELFEEVYAPANPGIVRCHATI
jgi:hypothetical protein